MTANVVNLRLARKRRARAEAETKAVENRVAFGRPKHERRQAEAERAHAERRLDGQRRVPPAEKP